MKLAVLATFLFSANVLAKLRYPSGGRPYNALSDHTIVTETNVFPFVVAVLKKFSYLSAGALLNDNWVLSAADALFLVRESTRIIKVRLGSINYKKGGIILPVKLIEVHPNFVDSKPSYDVALVQLGERVKMTPTLRPVRLQTQLQEVTTTHFIVTAWTPMLRITSNKKRHFVSMDMIKRRRMLSVSHLHPSAARSCAATLAALAVSDARALMCLEPDMKTDPCWRDTGAPVILNGVLWGVVSSWRPDDCYAKPSASFVSLVAAPTISSWLSDTITNSTKNAEMELPLDDDYDSTSD